MTPSNAQLRQFIMQAFSDEELETLCFDYFPELQQNFTVGMTRNRKALALISYCDSRGLREELLATLERERSSTWHKQFGRMGTPTVPPPERVSRRNPRQIFLSHATTDATFAHQLAADLREEGWAVWIAPDSIQPGEKWVEAINRGLEESGVFIVVLTPDAVASRWVQLETNAAISLEHRDLVRFIPLDHKSCDLPLLWGGYQYIPFRTSYEAGLLALLNRLEGTKTMSVPKPSQRYAKMVLLGEGSTGKTSVVERLVGRKPPSGKGKTEGVEISTWDLDSREIKSLPGKPLDTRMQVRIKVWDFGGQEIYHATHRFFLTRRTLYLVVIDSRQGESDGRLDHWLQLVGSSTGGSSVVVVVNKSDLHALELDERSLREAYPFVKDIVVTSCITGDGFEQLRDSIVDHVLDLPQVLEDPRERWLEVMYELEGMANNYITFEKYQDICTSQGILEPAEQVELAKLLHDLGIVLCFAEDRRLASTSVLNPEWVTRGIYKALSSPDIKQRGGVFGARDLERLLPQDEYPRHRIDYLLDLMQRFDMCFPIHGSDNYLLPDLLPRNAPDLTEFERGGLELYYDYSGHTLSPSAVLSRLIVQLNRNLVRDMYWRNGAVIEFEANRALVMFDRARRRLVVKVIGFVQTRRNLMSIIRSALLAIQQDLSGVKPIDEYVPVPGKGDYALPYNTLKNLEALGNLLFVDPYNDNLEVDVRLLLEGIEPVAENDLIELHKKLLEHFSLPDLKRLCFELGVEDEDILTDATKPEFAIEMLRYLQRRGEVSRLVALCRAKRKRVRW